MSEDTALKNLRADLRAAGQEFAGRLDDLASAAEALVALEVQLRVAETQAGIRDPRPPARELAHDMLLGRLGCLRPYLAFGTAESADRATEALCTAPAKPKPAKART